MTIYLIATALSLIYLFHLAVTAPVGYEDEHGFHYGYPPVIDE